MTATVTTLTVRTITSNIYGVLSVSLGVVVIALLLLLLVLKETRRAIGGSRSGEWNQTFNIAIVPLLFAFGMIVTMRLIDLLGSLH